jgi:hypothetical protein
VSDWKSHKSEHGIDATVYNVAAQEATERINLGNDAWMLVRDLDGLTLEFAVFEMFALNCSDGTPDEHTMLFHGCGPSGALRECRHIWWGDEGDGYTFSLNFDLVERAFRELRRWYD